MTNESAWPAAIAAVAMVASCASAAVAQPNPAYHVRTEYKLEGTGSAGSLWLDSAARRLYVARGDRVEALDADTGRRQGSMAAQEAAGVLVAEGTGHGFFANLHGNSVTMFDPSTLAVIKVIPLAVAGPESMTYDADVQKVFVVAPEGGKVVALDAQSGEVAGTVALQGHLRQAVSNGYGSLYVAAQDANVIHVVDTHSLKFLGDIPSGDAEGPISLAIDPSGRRLFVACADGKLPVIDTDIGFTFEELPIGSGDSGSAFTFTPQGKGGWKGADFVASDDGTLALVKMNAFINYSAGGKVSIAKGIHDVTYDSKTHQIYLTASVPVAEVIVMAPEPVAEVNQ
jgi:DNA-binding beta-propeller fold protein YncE